jgi:hypothetical protein
MSRKSDAESCGCWRRREMENVSSAYWLLVGRNDVEVIESTGGRVGSVVRDDMIDESSRD